MRAGQIEIEARKGPCWVSAKGGEEYFKIEEGHSRTAHINEKHPATVRVHPDGQARIRSSTGDSISIDKIGSKKGFEYVVPADKWQTVGVGKWNVQIN